MVKDKRRLLRAVKLLDQIIEEVQRSSSGGRDSPGRLLTRLVRLRGILKLELERAEPSWRAVVIPLFREVVRLIGELMINNLPYTLRPWRHGFEGYRVWLLGSR